VCFDIFASACGASNVIVEIRQPGRRRPTSAPVAIPFKQIEKFPWKINTICHNYNSIAQSLWTHAQTTESDFYFPFLFFCQIFQCFKPSLVSVNQFLSAFLLPPPSQFSPCVAHRPPSWKFFATHPFNRRETAAETLRRQSQGLNTRHTFSPLFSPKKTRQVANLTK